MALAEPTNSPAPMTPAMEIIVTWRGSRPAWSWVSPTAGEPWPAGLSVGWVVVRLFGSPTRGG